MRHFKYILTFVSALALSTLAFADKGHEKHGSYSGNPQSKHSVGGKHRGYSENRHSYGNNHHNYGYNNRHDYYRHDNRRDYGHHDYGNNHRRNYGYYDYRRYDNNRYRNYRHYNNYRPYYQSRYQYRPLRGLGYYFSRPGYGYGHWHDGMWCVTVHPQSYYYDYYSNYPYDGGWRYGDGDYGINFYFRF